MSDFWAEAETTAKAASVPHRTRKAVYSRGNEWNTTPRDKLIRELKNNRALSLKSNKDRLWLEIYADLIEAILWD